MLPTPLYTLLEKYAAGFHPVVPFDGEKDKLLPLDFTAANTTLTTEILLDTNLFSDYVNTLLETAFTYGIGGYNEHRTIYARSAVFDADEEPRRLHLGIDVWGAAGTPVFAALDGRVHSFAFNNFYGDYGATIILQHQLEGTVFHTLYGHLALHDLDGLQEGFLITKGTEFAHFGKPKENGHWPPHLHFQIVENMGGRKGDYPGVCRFSEREQYLANSPDPDVILRMMKYANAEVSSHR